MGIEEGRGEEGMEVWVNLKMDEEKPQDDAFAVTHRHAQLSTALSVGWDDCAKDRKLSSNSDIAQNKEDVVVYICNPRTSMTRLSSCLCFRNTRDPLPKMNPPIHEREI